MQFPQQTYRWLVCQSIIPNQGIMMDKKTVGIPASLAAHFDSGFNIGKIVKSILERSGKNVPSALNSLRHDTAKNVKLTNWNFIWLAFDDLDMQVDGRIKDLILQGETALVVEIVKQLFERDSHKNEEEMKKIVILERAGNKNEKSVSNGKSEGKGHTVDIKKINLQKNPDQSQSSLEFLILLLSSSLGMQVEEILGLFTNQNKYLAHIIVKGLNDNFAPIVLFYTLLLKHWKKLKDFIEDDIRDAESCLYAIKPGFISKSQDVAQLTIQVFLKLDKNVYHWLVGESRGSTTLLLGFKRHPNLAYPLWQLLSQSINENDVDFFTSHYKESFRDIREMIEITSIIAAPLGQSFVGGKLLDMGILAEWIQMSLELFEGKIDDQELCFSFLGDMMLYLPDSIAQNQECLQIFEKDWPIRTFINYLRLLDCIFDILNKLAANKSHYASKVYQILINIFQSISNDPSKKQYLVENFSLLIPDHPKMPTQYFIQAYQGNYLDAADYHLIEMSVKVCDNIEGLTKIAEVLTNIFEHNAVVNCYLAPIIYAIAKRIQSDNQGQQFIKRAIKNLLKVYSNEQIHKKIPQVAKQQPMYFNYRGNSQKVSEEVSINFTVSQKLRNNTIELISKLVDLIRKLNNDVLESEVKNQLLDANAFIRKNKNKVTSKGITNILRKLGISKEDQIDYDEEYRNKKELMNMEESLARKKNIMNNLSVLASSRVGGPEHLRKQFSDMIEKRRKQQQQKKAEEQKRMKMQTIRDLQQKKQIQRQKLVRGYGSGEAELKEEGFWSKLIKQEKQLEVYPPALMEQRDIDMIENLFRKYHRVVRSLFMKYTASMYSVKSIHNFEDNQQRKQTIVLMQIIKFLKDYKLFFLTNHTEVQNLVRDVNVKLLNKKETTQDLDFTGFQHFLVQFASTIFTKSHTVNAKTSKGIEAIKRNLIHVGHGQLLYELIQFLKLVFIEKGEKTIIFDEPEAAYFNEGQVIKQFNKKIEADPSFILPEGFKKVVDKNVNLRPFLYPSSEKVLNDSWFDVYMILDEIISTSQLDFHLIEPLSEVTTRYIVKPSAFANIKPKLASQSMDLTKNRAATSLVQRKNSFIPPIKILQRKVLSLGMKLGLSYVNYKDKLLGEQVAYVIDDMLNAVEQGKNTIQKQKIMNQVLKKKKQQQYLSHKMEKQKQRKRKQRKDELQVKKKQITQKKQRQLAETKQQRQKKQQKKKSIQKKKKEQMQKYLNDQKSKIKQKKQKQQEEKKQNNEKQKKKQEVKKVKQKFKSFNQEQIQKFQKGFNQISEKKKKGEEQQIEEKKHYEEVKKKLRNKITAQDRKIIEIRQKNNQEISELYSSPEISQTFKKYEANLKGLFDFLIKNSFLSLTERSHNNQVTMQSWQDFNINFQLNPLIIHSKQLGNIFRSLTKDKQIRKQYLLGLNFEEFQQALLRVVIKHKTVFNKIAQKIRESDMSQKQINSVIDKDMQEKQRNQFDQPKEIDVKNLLVEQDINKEIIDDYGDIKKVTETTLKGLIFYLKVPKDKSGQEKRFRQILAKKDTAYMQKYQKLKNKLKEQYTLTTANNKKEKNPVSPQKPEEESPSPKKGRK